MSTPPLSHVVSPTRRAGVAEFKNGIGEEGGRKDSERWQQKDSDGIAGLED